MRMLLMKLVVIVAVAILAGFGVASVTVGASASSEQTGGEVGSALQIDYPDRLTQVNHYETPCYKREREARGIPLYSVDDSKGLMAYVYKHLEGETPDAELAEFWAALNRCKINEPVAKWDFDNMILVSVEYI